MARNILAILLTPVVWGVVGVPANQVIFMVFPEALEGATPMPYLLTALVASVLYSLVSGATGAAVARPDFGAIGLWGGVALLAVGVSMQVAYWDSLPVWYHLIFLALLMPACMAGARLVQNRRRAPQTA